MNTPKEVSDVKNYYFFKWACILHFSASSKVGENNANLEKKKAFWQFDISRLILKSEYVGL